MFEYDSKLCYTWFKSECNRTKPLESLVKIILNPGRNFYSIIFKVKCCLFLIYLAIRFRMNLDNNELPSPCSLFGISLDKKWDKYLVKESSFPVSAVLSFVPAECSTSGIYRFYHPFFSMKQSFAFRNS